MNYDPNNIFARILRGEIPCNRVHETEHALAFHDIHPWAPVHFLIIPKERKLLDVLPEREAHADFEKTGAMSRMKRSICWITIWCGLPPTLK